MMTTDTTKRVMSPLVLLLFVAGSLGLATHTFADYQVFAISGGSSAVKIDPGDSVDLEIWLVSDNEETSDSVILQLVFSVGGLTYESYGWHGVFQDSIYEDSTPGNGYLPLVLTEYVLSGPGHPPGVVDIELSNAVLGAFCVDSENDSSGSCDCPEGRCIGGVCVGGPGAGQSCSLPCAANEQCKRVFDSGRLATLRLTVPVDYAGPELITVNFVPDAIANGFDELDATECTPFHIYLNCVAPGDFDCDGQVALSDHGEFLGCMTGPGGNTSPPCATFDLDDDGDVDLVDWGELEMLFDIPCGAW
ncbi:MAG: hypothetical protein ACYTFA_16990 [Planctomycetota bacterium]|jgi:hypothetical protein